MRRSRRPASLTSARRHPQTSDGPGDIWSPEHLLLASVQTCFLFTLRAIASASHVDFISLDLDATSTVGRQDGVTRFAEIVLRPHLVIAGRTDRERALRMLEKSEKQCLVSASLPTPIRLEPEITER
jgi:organic hydroperoxide reductase OsmC/OhrA